MMDTSKQYIKMCDCPEIQDKHFFMLGDFYSLKLDARVISNVPNSVGHVYYKAGIFARSNYITTDGSETDGFIWLPRQDQLQEMLIEWINKDGGTSTPSLYLSCRFAKFCGIFDQDDEGSSNIYTRKGSMEQLWLAFVMHELYNKKWNGEKWEDEPCPK